MSKGICSVEDCAEPAYAKGMCHRHNRQMRQRGYVGDHPAKACVRCGSEFIPPPAQPYQRWCTATCRESDPEFQENALSVARQYKDRHRAKLLNERRQGYADRTHEPKPYAGPVAPRYPEKRSARAKVAAALASGRLVKPPACSECDQRTPVLQAHHDDYAKPLDVRWLCTRCHGRAHWKPL
jgi:ribosomal protein S27AE